MSDTPPVGPASGDLRAEVRRAVAFLGEPAPPGSGATSDLTIDEMLILHAIGWEPLELVTGVSVVSIPWGTWYWGQGEIVSASAAYERALSGAIGRLHADAASAGGHGIVGVHIERKVDRTHVDVSVVGTAVRPIGASGATGPVFVSDLSARDFALLLVAGWEPLGLAHGASFVYAPRRSVGAVVQQRTQNVELTNYTEAMYRARETAMERMQQMALQADGSGVVEVKMNEGPLGFASHAVGFAAVGTVVRASPEAQRHLTPQVVVSLDDPIRLFEAATLE